MEKLWLTVASSMGTRGTGCNRAAAVTFCSVLVTVCWVARNCCSNCWIFCWSCSWTFWSSSSAFWSCEWDFSSCSIRLSCSSVFFPCWITSFFSSLNWSSLMSAAARGGKATASAQPAAANPKTKRVFIVLFGFGFNRSTAAVFLEIFEDHPRLPGRKVGAHAHVQQDGFPLRRRPFRRVTLGMAAVAMYGIKLGAGEFLRRGLHFRVRGFLFRLLRLLRFFGRGRVSARVLGF